jgi:hypothetical protein
MHQIVPKASRVAGPVQPLVPDETETARARVPAASSPAVSPALACPHTGVACPALTALFAPLAPAGDEAREWVQKLAPCPHCRTEFAAGRDRLRHVRLGQREREILLGAASGVPFAVTEPGMTRSLSAARRRAALSITKAGLVAPATVPAEPRPGATRHARATVTLTPLGRYVLAAYGRFIEAGKPVRWTRPARRAELPGADPIDLKDEVMTRTRGALRETLDELKGVLMAAVARPHRDPALLDSVTRHLEQKANVLRAVLEPAIVTQGLRAVPTGR